MRARVKGFDYGGKIETHESCNNHFGSEDYCRNALKIISKLRDPDCISTIIHKKDPSIKIMVLNSECFDDFTHKDLSYFKIRDVRENDHSEIKNPEFIKNGAPTNIKKTVLFNTFAVLVKSAAALLIKRFFKEIPHKWKVLAVPYHGVTDSLNFNKILVEAKPFDKDVKIQIKDLNGGVYLVLYIAYGVMFFLFFQIVEDNVIFKEISKRFPDVECYHFEGTCINDLIDYQWETLKQKM